MQQVIQCVLLLGALGLVGAIVLVVASRLLAVEVDDRLPVIEEMLPGANCGSCGYPGCSAYAKALLEGAPNNLCGPGGAEVASKVAEYLGTDAGEVVVKRAIVACRGVAERLVLKEREHYEGPPSCRAYATLSHLSPSCTDGCIGYGDCMATCPYGAITLNKNSVAVVDPGICIGCGLCTTICPRHLISTQVMTDRKEVSFVLCHNTLMGKRALEACANTCIGCRRCVRVCPKKCITVENNVAHIDTSECVNCKACMGVCPEGAIYPLLWVPHETPQEVVHEVQQ